MLEETRDSSIATTTVNADSGLSDHTLCLKAISLKGAGYETQKGDFEIQETKSCPHLDDQTCVSSPLRRKEAILPEGAASLHSPEAWASRLPALKEFENGPLLEDNILSSIKVPQNLPESHRRDQTSFSELHNSTWTIGHRTLGAGSFGSLELKVLSIFFCIQ